MYQAFLSLLPFYNLWIKTRIHQRQTNTGLKAFKEGKIRIDSVCMVVCSAIVNIVTVQPLFRTLSGESKNTVVQNSRRSRELIINDLRANPRERVCSGFEITEISTETKRKESKSQTLYIAKLVILSFRELIRAYKVLIGLFLTISLSGFFTPVVNRGLVSLNLHLIAFFQTV